jgi:hypothetical protein
MSRHAAALLFVLATLSCARQTRRPHPVPEWQLSTLPRVDIGVTEGDEPYELSSASSSLRLPDGRILVANGGTSDVREFDAEGRFLRHIGRKGAGPGEFDGPPHLELRAGGGFSAFDMSQERLSIFDSSGKFVSETRIPPTDRESFPLSVWLYGRNWVEGPSDTTQRRSVRSALNRLPPLPVGGFRFVKVADDGRLWSQVRVTDPAVTEPWTIYSSLGNTLATLNIPNDLEVHQIGANHVLARRWEANDVEHIQLFAIEGETSGPGISPTSPANKTADSVSAEIVQRMALALNKVVGAQEAYYADSNGYAHSTGLLKVELPDNASLHLLEADRRGWVGLLAHPALPIICGMAVGYSTPPGWSEGVPKCSAGR